MLAYTNFEITISTDKESSIRRKFLPKLQLQLASLSPSYEYQTDSITIFIYEIRKLTSIYATVDKNNHPNK